MQTLRSDRIELRRLDDTDAAFVEALYASAAVTRTLLRIQQAISFEEAREFCQAPATACGEHRFGAALRAEGKLIALGSVRRHTEPSEAASIGYSGVSDRPTGPDRADAGRSA
jgi:RimJ/RimL family protein N-acetyltransferase